MVSIHTQQPVSHSPPLILFLETTYRVHLMLNRLIPEQICYSFYPLELRMKIQADRDTDVHAPHPTLQDTAQFKFKLGRDNSIE